MCAVDKYDQLHCWGNDDFNQCETSPGGYDFIAYSTVKAGAWHSCAIILKKRYTQDNNSRDDKGKGKGGTGINDVESTSSHNGDNGSVSSDI